MLQNRVQNLEEKKPQLEEVELGEVSLNGIIPTKETLLDVSSLDKELVEKYKAIVDDSLVYNTENGEWVLENPLENVAVFGSLMVEIEAVPYDSKNVAIVIDGIFYEGTGVHSGGERSVWIGSPEDINKGEASRLVQKEIQNILRLQAEYDTGHFMTKSTP